MWDYRVEVECMCNEQALISAFNFLNIALNKRNDLSDGVIDNLPFEFRIFVNSHEGYRKLISESESELSDLECKDYFVSLPSETLNRTQIVLTIKIESDDDVDIFTYRYFFLIVNQLLRKDDIVYFECPETYYHKVGSYFFYKHFRNIQLQLSRECQMVRQKGYRSASLSPQSGYRLFIYLVQVAMFMKFWQTHYFKMLSL